MGSGNAFQTSVRSLKGVGEARCRSLLQMGISTVGDLLSVYPRGYQNRGNTKKLTEIREEVRNGSAFPFSCLLTVSSQPRLSIIRKNLNILKFRAFDETGSVEVVFFNGKFLKPVFNTGASFRFYGRFSLSGSSFQLQSPVYERVEDGSELPGIVPVYPLSGKLTQKVMFDLTSRALDMVSGETDDYLTGEDLEEYSLISFRQALFSLHRPGSLTDIEAAKKRLVFDELAVIFWLMRRKKEIEQRGNASPVRPAEMSDICSLFSFRLTGAQERALSDILRDMSGEHLMNRILTGDVGSGKTAVAEGAVYAAVRSGYSAVIMAPTEMLARQHFESFTSVFGPRGIGCGFISSSVPKAERRETINGFRSGSLKILIGTHALLSENSPISEAGLAVIDEQHRFGVSQRAALLDKAPSAHSLVMSATPIPRTLTLASYGSLDISRLDEMPEGRLPVQSFIVDESYRKRLNGFIRKNVDEGHQVYVVCPSIEETAENEAEDLADIFLTGTEPEEKIPKRSTAETFSYLKSVFPDLSVGCVHGKMKPEEREPVMESFYRGDTDILVSTTVIEVGVNVPNASLMIVENAEQFGLAQLHQLRGRVGRGSAQSYFIMISGTKSQKSLERLQRIKSTNDGFEIAEYDLETRGPGDFFRENGIIRQHGTPGLELAASCADPSVIGKASSFVSKLASEDPELNSPERKILKNKVTAAEDLNSRTTN
ncbi:MAG: ATP-dependent DNA helicase RecG [Clostridia bacterium]|nr:ATP-dependent DNA helicase RecG [Clostridia bacterium]